MPLYDFYCKTCGREESRTMRMAAFHYPECPEGHGEMASDFSKRDSRGMEGYLQEKGKFPFYDIQTDTTYHSHRQWRDDMKRRGLRPLERSEMSDRNRERFMHTHRGRKVL